MLLRGYGGLKLVAALAAVLAAAGCSTQKPDPEPAGLTAVTAPLGAASNRIGVLTLPPQNGSQSPTRACTASVIDSPGRDLLVTAAHCVFSKISGPAEGLTFVPGYRNGTSPHGSWTVDRITTDPHWEESEDPEYDVAFLHVRPLDGEQIEDVLGGNSLGLNLGFDLPVTVTGYPFTREEPITCSTRTTAQSSTQERFDCGAFSDGTSGSPWLTDVDPATGLGTVVGVIGGYQAGGDTPDVSYSVSFDDRVSALYREAIS
ncbi:V8-like Glu-specific endopeptidase [Kitasatospora sp. MAP12-15]|uniref:trypsin-like serine peptidase n=1 Tax=unclassified Kitasatospora TaxID=2633591 RepID=UPI002473C02E|nr:trypsin-like peptidase domain-containing protein [Kitasatospora sp. MAP12-44]MDH6110423.1 V8-like Glu-specific endopeptidase [Kitasatospora sp. MAP12-44]